MLCAWGPWPYKVLGRQASYDQWIVVSIVVITEDHLKGVGFYQDSSDSTRRLSREPSAVWADLTKCLEAPDDQRKLAEEIVSVNERDLEHLSTGVLEDILSCLPRIMQPC